MKMMEMLQDAFKNGIVIFEIAFNHFLNIINEIRFHEIL